MTGFAQITQKILAAAVFLGAIAIGMKMGGRAHGQMSPPVIPQAVVQATPFPIATPAEAAATSAGAVVTPTNTPAPIAQPPASAPNPIIIQQIVPATPPPAEAPKAPTPFVPSEVETFIPVPAKLVEPRMILRTSMGDVKVRLNYRTASQNVRNVAQLARGEREFLDSKTSKKVRRPFYTNLTFHRTLPGYLIQTGCPFGSGRGGPGYSIPDELSPAAQFSGPGIVAMAPERTGTDFKKDSNGSQFFITLRSMPENNDKLTIIGVVESGLDIVRKIASVKTGPTDRPIRRVFLYSIEIVDPSGLLDKPAK